MRNIERWRPEREQHGPAEVWGVVVQDSNPLLWIIRPTNKLDASDCQLICAAHNAEVANRGKEKVLWCESLVNRAGVPLVQVTLGAEMAQMEIREARHHAAALNEAIEAALSDAVILRFMREVIGGAEPQEIEERSAMLLQRFRDFREEVIKPPTTESELES